MFHNLDIRREIFGWLGVVGAAITIVSSIEVIIKLAGWVQALSSRWREFTFSVWERIVQLVLPGWSVDEWSALMLTANLFIFWICLSSATVREFRVFTAAFFSRRETMPQYRAFLPILGCIIVVSLLIATCYLLMIIPFFAYGSEQYDYAAGTFVLAFLVATSSKFFFEGLALDGEVKYWVGFVLIGILAMGLAVFFFQEAVILGVGLFIGMAFANIFRIQVRLLRTFFVFFTIMIMNYISLVPAGLF